ncbi:hypothetical protein DTR82_24480 [Salmonella enterica subsp. enterica serovar Javiana]|nr:hypothetical protein [Salmonella enterica subsp. enterica serovar Javiana]
MTHLYFRNKSSDRLRPGEISEQMFDILIDISQIRSEKCIDALRGHFVEMKTRSEVCDIFNVNKGYLSVKINELQSLLVKIINFYPHYAQSILKLK